MLLLTTGEEYATHHESVGKFQGLFQVLTVGLRRQDNDVTFRKFGGRGV